MRFNNMSSARAAAFASYLEARLHAFNTEL
jgi:hypothetical protein